MSKPKWVKLGELRQPGMRRALEAMMFIEQEVPTTLLDASASRTVAFHEPQQRRLSEARYFAEG